MDHFFSGQTNNPQAPFEVKFFCLFLAAILNPVGVLSINPSGQLHSLRSFTARLYHMAQRRETSHAVGDKVWTVDYTHRSTNTHGAVSGGGAEWLTRAPTHGRRDVKETEQLS